MDYALAIRRNREQLRQIVLALFALANMRVGGSLFTLRRDVFAAIMLVLRPAESAVRRLIVIAAIGLAPSTSPRLRGPQAGETGGSPWSVPGCAGRRGDFPPIRAFKLFDPLKSFDPDSIWDVEPVWESNVSPSDPTIHFTAVDTTPLDATRIGQRLNALIRALDNLPAQARRLMRWQSKRDAALKASKPTRLSPIRPGLPPGWRERKIHEIDDVLRECHGLAHDQLNSS
ncbi:MAG: hypothetical protein WCC66_09180 [Rhizobiaceae bacterium]